MTFTVFLDRDGVFNEHRPLGIWSARTFRMLPGAAAAFGRLCALDVVTCLVTNQPAVGYGLTTRRRVEHVNELLRRELAASGGRLDHIECAYAPTWLRNRRTKPRPGMLEDGLRALSGAGHAVDVERAVMIGDKPKDALAGNALGIPAVLVATTYTKERLAQAVSRHRLDATVVGDLAGAVDVVSRRVA